MNQPWSSASETLLQTVQADIKTEFPRLKTVDLHGGRFTVTELKRYSKIAPAVVISILRTRRDEPNTCASERTLVMSATVIARNQRRQNRHLVAVSIAEQLSEYIATRANWGLQIASVETINLYSTTLDRIAVALYGVSWKQTITIPEDYN